MSQVVTELVIDAQTGGADDFSRAMDGAAQAAGRATSSAASVALSIAGVGVAAVGMVAGLRAFIDYTGQQSQALVDLANHAAIAGVSTKEFQQIIFAARSQGVTEKDFVSGLDKISADLQQAGQGVTQFSKLFEANGIAIKDQNGQLITTKAALTDIMTLMQNASPAVQQQIAKIVGLSADWIPFLKEGVAQFEAQKQAALSLGVVIEDSTIAKAGEFNAQWKTAVATWDLQFKASLASILPLLTQLATLASQVISGIGAVSGSIGRWTAPDDQKTKAQLDDQISDAFRLRDAMVELGGISDSSFAGHKARNLAGLLGLPEDASLAQVDQLIGKLAALYDKTPTKLTVNPVSSTVLPPGDQSSDAVDRAINSLQKHIQLQIADAQAVGLGDGALAGFKATAAETAAVLANGGKETEAQAASFVKLRQAAIDAADGLAKAKVASQIDFNAKTSFLSAGDAAIAQQLKGIYGNDVTGALNSAYAAQMRFNAAAKEVSSAIENDLVTGLTDITTHAKSVGQGFSDMGLAVVKSIEQMVIKIAVVQPLMAALQATVSSSGLGGLLGIGANPIAAGGVVPGAVGPTSVGGGALVGLHDGGIVGAEATFSRYVHPAYFDQAPRMHGGGIAGNEVPIIAQRGEGVFTAGQMAALGQRSAPQVNVTLVENPNAAGAVTQRQNSNGGIDIEVAIAQIAAKSAARPGAPLNRILTDQLGSKQRLASR